MVNFTILAATTARAVEDTAAQSTVVPINTIWQNIINLTTLEAMTFMAFGVVCLFYGWRVFKALTVMAFAGVGLGVGYLISQKLGNPGNPLLGVILGIVFAIASLPLMKWAVGLLGAVAGGVITAALWYAAKLPEQYLWAGGLIGFVGGGMISFIVFKIAIMLFSSLSGSALIVTGLFAMLYKYDATTAKMQELFFGPKWFIAVALILPALFGLYWQNRFIKKSPEWSV